MNKQLLLLSLVLCLRIGNIEKTQAQSFNIKPYTAASKRLSQGGQGPDKSYDSNSNTLYHSAWNRSGIPDTLDYYFSRAPKIDSLKYTPRQDGSSNGRWGEVEIWATSEYPPHFEHITTVNWQQTKAIKSLKLPGTGIDLPLAIRFVVKSAYGNFSSVAEMAFYGPEPQTAPISESIPTDSIETFQLGDIKIPVSGGSASNFQPGQNIEKSFDGNHNTLYHSNYSNRTFPITLEYDFTAIDQIDYIQYYPRTRNKNGLFGRIKVEARTKTGTYQTVIDTFDCGKKSSPSLILFPTAFHNPAQVKITVLSGYNDFASAAEIEFYKKGVLENDYQTIFTDHLYRELQPGITQENINPISNPFFKKLAQNLFDGHYTKKFRVQNYAAVPHTSKTRQDLNVAFEYSRYQNPTGIVFEANSTAVIFADHYNTEAGLIYLKVTDFANETSGETSTYLLKPGLNKLTITNRGLGYIEYYSETPDLPPVMINIASGTVNGYLSPGDSFTERQNILTNSSSYPKVDVTGHYFGMNVLKRPLLENALFNGSELIQKWDTIVKLQFHQMGLLKYDKIPANKMFAKIESKNGYYATGNYAHFDLSWGEKAITSAQNMDIWGVSHEFGHQNQLLNGLIWTGTTEVTTNIYSAYATYLLGTSKLTRLESANDSYRDVSLVGNLYNIYNNEFGLKKQNIMSRNNVFERLLPFWQLQLFYAIAGAGVNAPSLEQVMANKNITGNTNYANWFGITAQTIRNATTKYNNGQQMMNFVKFVSDAVQQDLTEFFTKAGFLIPFDAVVNDYTPGRITITTADIEATKAYIAGKGYPQPQSPVLHYITARNMFMYKNMLAPEGVFNTGFSIDTTTFPGKTYYKIIHNIWKNAVAFETIDADNNVLFSTTYATGDTTNQTTMVLFPENAVNIYAVGADGTRLPVLDTAVLSIHSFPIAQYYNNDNTVEIAPNPASTDFTITTKDDTLKQGFIINTNGQVVKEFTVNVHTHVTVTNLATGLYFILLENTDGSRIIKKIVINHS